MMKTGRVFVMLKIVKRLTNIFAIPLAVAISIGHAQTREPIIYSFQQDNTILLKLGGGCNLDNDESFEVVGIAARLDGKGNIIPYTSYLVYLEDFGNESFVLLWSYRIPSNHRGDFVDVKLTDLNHDGFMELVAIANIEEMGSGKPEWLYVFEFKDEFPSEPTAIFSAEISQGIRARPITLDIKDLNGDGREEIVVATGGAQRGVIILGLISEAISDGLKILAQSFNLPQFAGIKPFSIASCDLGERGSGIAVVGGSQIPILEIYSWPLSEKAYAEYKFNLDSKEELNLSQFRACDLDGNGVDEFLLPIKSGGGYLVYFEGETLKAAKFIPKDIKIEKVFSFDINNNQLDDLFILATGRQDLIRVEYNFAKSLADFISYDITFYSNPGLIGLKPLTLELVFSYENLPTGALVIPYLREKGMKHGLIYWWIEEVAEISRAPEIESLLGPIDSTLAVQKETQESQLQMEEAPLSEREAIRKQLEKVQGFETELAPIKLQKGMEALPPSKKWPKPDLLAHVGEKVEYDLKISNLKLSDVKDLAVQVNTPPGMRFDLSALKFNWVPSDTQLGWHKVSASLSWGKNREAASFSVYVNDPPRIVSAIPPRNIIQIGEAFRLKLNVVDNNADASLGYKLVKAPYGATVNLEGEVFWKPSLDQADWYEFLIEVTDGYDSDSIGFEVFVNHPVSIESTPPDKTAIGKKYTYIPQIVDNNRGFYLTDYVTPPKIIDWRQTGIIEIKLNDDNFRRNMPRYIERYRKSFPMSNDPNSSVLFQDIFEDDGKVVFVYNLTAAQALNATQIVNSFFNSLGMTPPSYSVPEQKYFYKFALKEAPPGMQISPQGVIEWIPSKEQFDLQSFTFTVSDGFFTCEQHAEVYVNAPPIIISKPDSIAQVNVPWQYKVEVKDLNTDSKIKYELLSAPDGMTISPEGIIRWRPTEKQVKYQSFTLRVSDGMASDVQRAKIFVNARPRIITQPTPVAMVGVKYIYQIEAEDLNDKNLKYRALRLPREAVFDPTTHILTWTPTKRQVGAHTVILEVKDPHGWNAIQEFQVHVYPSPKKGGTALFWGSLLGITLVSIYIALY